MSHRRKPQPRPYVRSRDELEAALRRQYGFLVKSAALFDAGDPDEARRLALTIRVLVHGDRPLLHLLGLRKQLRFVDTALRHPRILGAVVIGCELVTTMRTDFDANRTSWAAPLDDREGEQAPSRFATWWGTPVVTTSKGILSREQIVLPMANQGSGAHEDAHLRRTTPTSLRRHAASRSSPPANRRSRCPGTSPVSSSARSHTRCSEPCIATGEASR